MKQLLNDESGAASFIEYLALFTFIGLLCFVPLITLMGPPMLRFYRLIQFIVLSPIS